jgi:hypothetical protein
MPREITIPDASLNQSSRGNQTTPGKRFPKTSAFVLLFIPEVKKIFCTPEEIFFVAPANYRECPAKYRYCNAPLIA